MPSAKCQMSRPIKVTCILHWASFDGGVGGTCQVNDEFPSSCLEMSPQSAKLAAN